MGIFAEKDIPVGEEITYDYQFQHHGLAAAANAYRCAPSPTPSALKPWSRKPGAAAPCVAALCFFAAATHAGGVASSFCRGTAGVL